MHPCHTNCLARFYKNLPTLSRSSNKNAVQRKAISELTDILFSKKNDNPNYEKQLSTALKEVCKKDPELGFNILIHSPDNICSTIPLTKKRKEKLTLHALSSSNGIRQEVVNLAVPFIKDPNLQLKGRLIQILSLPMNLPEEDPNWEQFFSKFQELFAASPNKQVELVKWVISEMPYTDHLYQLKSYIFNLPLSWNDEQFATIQNHLLVRGVFAQLFDQLDIQLDDRKSIWALFNHLAKLENKTAVDLFVKWIKKDYNHQVSKTNRISTEQTLRILRSFRSDNVQLFLKIIMNNWDYFLIRPALATSYRGFDELGSETQLKILLPLAQINWEAVYNNFVGALKFKSKSSEFYESDRFFLNFVEQLPWYTVGLGTLYPLLFLIKDENHRLQVIQSLNKKIYFMLRAPRANLKVYYTSLKEMADKQNVSFFDFILPIWSYQARMEGKGSSNQALIEHFNKDRSRKEVKFFIMYMKNLKR